MISMDDYLTKCDCYIHSLKKGETHVLDEATIIRRLGDNDYLAQYKEIQCHAIFNPFVGRYYVDDKYGIIHKPSIKDAR